MLKVCFIFITLFFIQLAHATVKIEPSYSWCGYSGGFPSMDVTCAASPDAIKSLYLAAEKAADAEICADPDNHHFCKHWG